MTSKDIMKNAGFMILSIFIIKAMISFAPIATLSRTYNIYGPDIAPNIVTTILFDFRGYDTLGECVILVSGVLALSILYGRGIISGDLRSSKLPSIETTNILKPFTWSLAPLLVALGIMVTLGGHITPGGGFQGGSIIAASFFMVIVLVGARSVRLDHWSLLRMESIGLSAYLILGLVGWYFSGHYLYNLGFDMMGIAEGAASIFEYPDNFHSGIIPYLNIAVMLKVSAGLATALILILEGRR